MYVSGEEKNEEKLRRREKEGSVLTEEAFSSEDKNVEGEKVSKIHSYLKKGKSVQICQ
jgi:hypothetical protein